MSFNPLTGEYIPEEQLDLIDLLDGDRNKLAEFGSIISPYIHRGGNGNGGVTPDDILWELITADSLDYVRPKDSTDKLLVGANPHSSIASGSFSGLSALFNGDTAGTNGGTNYFVNLGYGISILPFGGIFLGGRARGTPSAPTGVVSGDWLGGTAFSGYDGSSWALSGANHVLPAWWVQTTANPVAGSGVIEAKHYLGGLTTPMISFNTLDNAIKFNESLLDSDITFYWDSGTAFAIDGATGNTTFSEDVYIDTGGTTNFLRFGDSAKVRGNIGHLEFSMNFGSKEFKFQDTGQNDVFTIDGDTGSITSSGTITAGTQPTYTPTNVSTDRSYDANATTIDELADILGTLIADLQAIGLLQ